MMTSQKSNSENLVEPAARKEKKKCRAQGRLKMPEVRKSLGPHIILGQPLRTYKKDWIKKITLSKFPRASGLHMCLSPPLPQPRNKETTKLIPGHKLLSQHPKGITKR